MPGETKKPKDAELNREIQRFSMQALELAKALVDGSEAEAAKKKGQTLSDGLRDFVAKARELSDAYRPGAMKTLADARLDLAFVAAGGKGASSTRLGWYIKEKAEAGGSDN